MNITENTKGVLTRSAVGSTVLLVLTIVAIITGHIKTFQLLAETFSLSILLFLLALIPVVIWAMGIHKVHIGRHSLNTRYATILLTSTAALLTASIWFGVQDYLLFKHIRWNSETIAASANPYYNNIVEPIDEKASNGFDSILHVESDPSKPSYMGYQFSVEKTPKIRKVIFESFEVHISEIHDTPPLQILFTQVAGSGSLKVIRIHFELNRNSSIVKPSKYSIDTGVDVAWDQATKLTIDDDNPVIIQFLIHGKESGIYTISKIVAKCRESVSADVKEYLLGSGKTFGNRICFFNEDDIKRQVRSMPVSVAATNDDGSVRTETVFVNQILRERDASGKWKLVSPNPDNLPAPPGIGSPKR